MSASGARPIKKSPAKKSIEKPIVTLTKDLLSEYRLLALVGQGEFAQVYCAVHRRSGQIVAIKQTRHARQLVSQEPLVMQRVKHPNVVGCYAISKAADELGYQLVLEYCEGGTLRSHLNSAQNTAMPLSLAEIQPLIEDLLSGLAHIHQRGIIHGDLKPENIFLTYPDSSQASLCPVAKIGDFGSARLTTRSSLSTNASSNASSNAYRREIGSPTYAAPERFDGHSSIYSDLYSVGVILYELLTGDRPFSGSPESLREAHQTKAVPLPAFLTPAVQKVLTIALHKQPQQRFSSATEMLSAVQQLFTNSETANSETANSETGDSEHSLAMSVPIQLSHTSLSQKAIALPSYGITAPVESLLNVPQGCCLITDRSLHLITHRREFLSIARFRHPCWIAVSPDGKWFVALPKTIEKQTQSTHDNHHKKSRIIQGMLGAFSSRSGHQWRRSMLLEGPLLTGLCAQVLQVVAVSSRYFLRVSTTNSRTFLECFTRSGRFVGEMALNIVLTQVVPTTVPYQLIGIAQIPGAQSAHVPQSIQTEKKAVLISLKPLQVNPIRLAIVPERVSAVPWGYFISHQRASLFLDKSAQPLSQLSEVPQGGAIAAIDSSTILIASNKARYKNESVTKTTTGVSLLVADVKSLNLDIIF